MAPQRRSGVGARQGLVLLAVIAIAGVLVWGAVSLGEDGPSDPGGNAGAPADPDDPQATEAPASGWAAPTPATIDAGLVDLDAATSSDLNAAMLDVLVESAPVVVTSDTAQGPAASAAADLARDLRVPFLVTSAPASGAADATASEGPDASASPAPTSTASAGPAASDLLESWGTEHVVAVGTPPATSATLHEVQVEVNEAPDDASPAADDPTDVEPVVTRPEQVDAMLADARAADPVQAETTTVVVRAEATATDDPPGDATETATDDETPTDDATGDETATGDATGDETATDDPSGDATEDATATGDAAATDGATDSADDASDDPEDSGADVSGLPDDLATNLAVLGVTTQPWSSDDPRDDAQLRTALSESDTALLAIADDQFPDAVAMSNVAPNWPALFRATAQAPELMGGGLTLFPHRTFIASYGNPSGPALGVLGERDVEGSIDYTEGLVDDYEGLFGDSQVQPAFELITTIASSEAGEDGDYSREEDLDFVTEWVDAATEAGVYVVLDLQPGRSDFLSQAKTLEDLLRRPNVGLALDPEWRLTDDQVHLEQIGTVTTAEVNEVSDWLAGLVRDEVLPQKLLIVHNFRLSMTTDREDMDFHPELATMVHVDGQGPQHLKDDTYKVITDAGPDELWWGWKNFYDEDSPETRSPEDTAQVRPVPHFISYQ